MRGITSLFFSCLMVAGCSFISTSVFAASANNNPNANVNSQLTAAQIKQAAESGDPDAQYALGYMYYYGTGGLPRSVAEAKRWIGKAADNKQAQAIRAQRLMAEAEQKKSMNQVQVANNSISTKPSAVAAKPSTKPSVTPSQNNYVMNSAKPASAPASENKFVAHNETITHHISNLDNKNTLQREKELEREAATETITKSRKEPKETLAETDEPVAHENASSSEKRLLKVPSHFYTVQLLAGENRDAVDRMVMKNDLKPKAAVYHTYRNAKRMYVLIYGQYKTKAQADVVATQLHKKLKLDPWVKSYASVKKSLSED